jgi:hypothetical protein
MATTIDLKNRITNITEEFAIIINKIKEPPSSSNLENEIREYENDTRKYDTEFEEMKGMQERFGGKTRKQSLQEFVLLFFYVAYALLSTSIIMYSFNFWGALSTLKIFVMLVIFLLGVTGIIIRYG